MKATSRITFHSNFGILQTVSFSDSVMIYRLKFLLTESNQRAPFTNPGFDVKHIKKGYYDRVLVCFL